jgi:hypothetical protein
MAREYGLTKYWLSSPCSVLVATNAAEDAIQDSRQLPLLDKGQQDHKIIDAFCRNRNVFFHALQYATEFSFWLSDYANEE